MEQRFEGQTAIVTGGADGIGKAVAQRLASEKRSGVTSQDRRRALSVENKTHQRVITGKPCADIVKVPRGERLRRFNYCFGAETPIERSTVAFAPKEQLKLRSQMRSQRR